MSNKIDIELQRWDSLTSCILNLFSKYMIYKEVIRIFYRMLPFALATDVAENEFNIYEKVFSMEDIKNN